MVGMDGSTEAAIRAMNLLRHWNDDVPARSSATPERVELYAATLEEVERADRNSTLQPVWRRLLHQLPCLPRRTPS